MTQTGKHETGRSSSRFVLWIPDLCRTRIIGRAGSPDRASGFLRRLLLITACTGAGARAAAAAALAAAAPGLLELLLLLGGEDRVDLPAGVAHAPRHRAASGAALAAVSATGVGGLRRCRGV